VTVRVVIADDQPLVRAGLRGLLQLDGDITVVGEAGDGPDALDTIRDTRPDVALLDIRMPHMDGIQVARRRILTKLAARDRARLVMLAYETGLVRPGQTGNDRSWVPPGPGRAGIVRSDPGHT
jgi:DNA-binding NarL/FixJ family response regulator